MAPRVTIPELAFSTVLGGVVRQVEVALAQALASRTLVDNP